MQTRSDAARGTLTAEAPDAVRYAANGRATSTRSGGAMAKPRIFLGSSGKQAPLLQSLTSGLADVADVEPWTATFNPGTTTLGRLVELTREVDFAAFVFAQDDWTSVEPAAPDADATAGQASPR